MLAQGRIENHDCYINFGSDVMLVGGNKAPISVNMEKGLNNYSN